MKHTKMLMLVTISIVPLVLVTEAAANSSGKVLILLLPLASIVLGLTEKLVGIAGVVGAGLYAKEHKEALPFANLVAGISGAWFAFAWLGWPWITSLRWARVVHAGVVGSKEVETYTFSFSYFLGSIFFAVVGIIICTIIANLKGKAEGTNS